MTSLRMSVRGSASDNTALPPHRDPRKTDFAISRRMVIVCMRVLRIVVTPTTTWLTALAFLAPDLKLEPLLFRRRQFGLAGGESTGGVLEGGAVARVEVRVL